MLKLHKVHGPYSIIIGHSYLSGVFQRLDLRMEPKKTIVQEHNIIQVHNNVMWDGLYYA